MATSVDAKLLKATKFPLEFNQKVDMKKVNLEVMKRWIAGKISTILGSEDDVVIELCFNLLEGARYPDIKKLQIQLTGFLEKDTAGFCKELWKLCLSAQSSPQGVPKELLEAKKLELLQEKIDAEKAADESRRRREIEQQKEKEIDQIRARERGERGRGSGRGDSWRGGRGDRGGFDRGARDFDRRGPRRSRSPAPRRRDSRERVSFRGPPSTRDIDTYVPSSRGSRRRNEQRRRSPSESLSPAHSPSRSASPPRRRRSVTESESPKPRRRSLSPDRSRGGYRVRGVGGRGRSAGRDYHRRSYTPSDLSRSRSPINRKRRRSPSKSKSPSPPFRSKRRSRRNSSSVSRPRSSSHHTSRDRLSRGRDRVSVSPDRNKRDIIRTSANARKGRDYDERRLTRSNSRDRSLTPPRRRRRTTSRSRSRSPGGKYRKRRRSIQRYAPASKRRNTSSDSSPTETRYRRADSSEDEPSRRSPDLESGSRSPVRDIGMTRTTDPQEIKPPEQQANKLREKLLRERIKKMRTLSASSSNAQTNNA